jgi:hypothetical protein
MQPSPQDDKLPGLLLSVTVAIQLPSGGGAAEAGHARLIVAPASIAAKTTTRCAFIGCSLVYRIRHHVVDIDFVKAA